MFCFSRARAASIAATVFYRQGGISVDDEAFDKLSRALGSMPSREGILATLANLDLSDLQVAILVALRRGPTHGWDLLKAVRQIYQEMGSSKAIASSTLYKNIFFLEDLGLVEGMGETVGHTNRPTRIVGLTEEGQKAAVIATERRLQEAKTMFDLVHGAA